MAPRYIDKLKLRFKSVFRKDDTSQHHQAAINSSRLSLPTRATPQTPEQNTTTAQGITSQIRPVPDIPSQAILRANTFTQLPEVQDRPSTAQVVGMKDDQAIAGLTRLVNAMGVIVDWAGPLDEVVAPIISSIRSILTVVEDNQELHGLRNQLEALSGILQRHEYGDHSPATAQNISKLALAIKVELQSVDRQRNHATSWRMLNAENERHQILNTYNRIRDLIGQFTVEEQLNQSTAIKNQSTILEGHSAMLENQSKIILDQETEVLLGRLKYSHPAHYRSSMASTLGRGACAYGTRVGLLDQMSYWLDSQANEKVYWLNGMAGTGKTTVAYSLCERLESDRRLAASFFCSRQLPECRDVSRIFPSISYQLSRRFPEFRQAVCLVLRSDPDALNQSVLKQFEQLVAQPIERMSSKVSLANFAIVIDALDECDVENGTVDVIKAVLGPTAPLPIKFFITSRPEASIIHHMKSRQSDGLKTEIRLHELAESIVQSDIRKYLEAELTPYLHVSDHQLVKLVDKSGVLFIYAATLVRYIGYRGFCRGRTRLAEVLDISGVSSKNSARAIDELYTAILNAAYDDRGMTESDRQELLIVLHTIVCAREPLSEEIMTRLLNLTSGSVNAALVPCLSVVRITDSGGIITTLHDSFREYLLESSRSGRFYCDSAEHNAYLAQRCFDQVEAQSKWFNLCELESPRIMDKNVTNIQERLDRYISKEMRYTCRYWGEHLTRAAYSPNISRTLSQFLSKRLLLWMEVMNLTGYFADGTKTMYELEEWLQSSDERKNETCQSLLADAWRFMSAYASSPAQLSTPHIYVSALSLWPSESPIGRSYQQKKPRVMSQKSTALHLRQTRPITTVSVRGVVLCLAYSADGKYVTSGSKDGLLQIWDTRSGRLVGQPLIGHIGDVLSLRYSPDGKHIVSGSSNRTICIWDTASSQPVGQPLFGHMDYVRSVGFSPDGKHIVSGSDDTTIRIWDMASGEQLGQPLTGHTGCVNSVGYSPDGKHIISGSDDRTIVTWDAASGQPVGQPLTAHTGSVNSVEYSPNGKYIVSGSGDRTIRIWDAASGRQVGQPLIGHTHDVNSVGYSPDGKHIVSGSRDGTIWIWEAASGQPLGQPLTAHTGYVYAVGYSPHGKHIVSGSDDMTIRIWDAASCHPVGQPLTAHTRDVSSVGYSPDGKHIISGSNDKTIRVWDAASGQSVGQPLTGHTGYINSVVYSPDGKHIVSGSDDTTIRIWDAVSDKLDGQPLTGHTNAVLSVRYSPDGSRVVSGSDDTTIRIWDVASGQQLGQPLAAHTSYVQSVAYSLDGRYIVSGSGDMTIRIWDASSGQQLGQPLIGHTHDVNSVGFSPDGKRVVSGSNDSTIRIWNAASGKPVGQPLTGHTDYVRSVEYSPDGRYIVSGSEDRTIRIWDSASGQPVVKPFFGHTDYVRSVRYSPDGKHIVSGSDDRTIRVWNSSLHTESDITAVGQDVASAESHICSSDCQISNEHRIWTLNQDGWVVVDDDEWPLFWVPPDLRPQLVYPQNKLTTSSPYGQLYLDFDHRHLGEHWAEHFMPITVLKPISW